MKKIIILLGVLLTACTRSSITKNKKYINSEGTTLETRILVPKGYQREQSDFAHFLQTYPLKENVRLTNTCALVIRQFPDELEIIGE